VKTIITENVVAAFLHMKDKKGREFSTDYFLCETKDGETLEL